MDERVAWNEWNTQSNREHQIGQVQQEQAAWVEARLSRALGGRPARLLEIGCGTGWMCERLARYGVVTGVDLADEVLERARQRLADLPITFLAGDVMTMQLDPPYDAIVVMETMAHFRDQEAFLRRTAELLADEGVLVIAAQNRPMMERNIKHLPNRGWYRRWVDHHELRELVEDEFDVADIRSITPKFFDGPLHVLNSERVEQLAGRVGLRRPLRRVKRWEEDRFLGFTLMCFARKKPVLA